VTAKQSQSRVRETYLSAFGGSAVEGRPSTEFISSVSRETQGKL